MDPLLLHALEQWRFIEFKLLWAGGE